MYIEHDLLDQNGGPRNGTLEANSIILIDMPTLSGFDRVQKII